MEISQQKSKTLRALLLENQQLRGRLGELEDVLDGIQAGEVDALVGYRDGVEKIYTLEGADRPYRILVEVMNEGALTLMPDGNILYCNSRFASMVRCPLEEIIGHSLDRFIAQADKQRLAGLIDHASAAGQSAEIKLMACDDTSLITQFSVVPLIIDTLQTRVVVITDVTETIASRDLLRQVSTRLLEARDEERRRIARDLHDGMAQYLSVLAINLALVEQTGLQDEKNSKRLQDAIALAEQCVSELRSIAYLLHPPILAQMGLTKALRSYVEGFSQRSKIAVALDLAPGLDGLSDEVSVALLRVVQECLTNIFRHAGGATASVRILSDPSGVCLEVVDYGRGPTTTRKQDRAVDFEKLGVGITGMGERAKELGGTLEISSGASGTTVRMALPARRNNS